MVRNDWLNSFQSLRQNSYPHFSLSLVDVNELKLYEDHLDTWTLPFLFRRDEISKSELCIIPIPILSMCDYATPGACIFVSFYKSNERHAKYFLLKRISIPKAEGVMSKTRRTAREKKIETFIDFRRHDRIDVYCVEMSKQSIRFSSLKTLDNALSLSPLLGSLKLKQVWLPSVRYLWNPYDYDTEMITPGCSTIINRDHSRTIVHFLRHLESSYDSRVFYLSHSHRKIENSPLLRLWLMVFFP